MIENLMKLDRFGFGFIFGVAFMVLFIWWKEHQFTLHEKQDAILGQGDGGSK